MLTTGMAAVRAALAMACCLGLAACSGGHAPVAAPASRASQVAPAGTATPGRTPTPERPATPGRTPSPATTVTPAGPSHTAVCRTSRLKITLLRGLAAGGTAGGYLGFASRARRPCTLHGWPAVEGIKATGETSAAIRRTSTMFGPNGPDAVPVVTLKPGALAVAVFTVADGRPPYCPPPYLYLRVTPPGNRRPVVIIAWLHPYVRGYLPACTRIWISPVVPAHYVYRP